MSSDPHAVYHGLDPALEALASDKAFLGKYGVAESLVRDFVHAVTHAGYIEGVVEAVDRMAAIFAGEDDGYQVNPGWNTHDELGMALADRGGVDPDQSLQDMLRTYFLTLATQVFETAKTLDQVPPEEWQTEIDDIIEYAASMLVGTIDLTHPDDDSDSESSEDCERLPR